MRNIIAFFVLLPMALGRAFWPVILVIVAVFMLGFFLGRM